MKYSIGLDFGTLSGRALLYRIDDGCIVAQAVMDYPHGVMDNELHDGQKLDPDTALQHPQDYLDVLHEIVPAVIEKGNVQAEDVIGIGVDFTGCTIIGLDAKRDPLCFSEPFKSVPLAHVILWKHHAAQQDADHLERVAREMDQEWIERYGGKVSSEFMIPKLMQILREAPEVYQAADSFMECGDWLVYKLTGEEARSACFAGYKALWNKKEGYPSKEFFAALDPLLENVVEEKLSEDIRSLGEKAGGLTEEAAEKLGLLPGTAVAVAVLDAHVAVPAVGITQPGEMLMIIGTSGCDIMLDEEEIIVKGICGLVEDGVMPGFIGYEAGQACVGDHFAWFMENCVPSTYKEEAQKREISLHTLMEEKAALLNPGESGLIALDWWNGNRSVLVDANLTGLLLGLKLSTKPEEIYRALIEALAFGLKVILDAFENSGVPVNSLFAAGGIASKNKLMMQIYSDITGREINVSDEEQTVALGSALFGAVAAGKEKGGYDSIFDAAAVMKARKNKLYVPNLMHEEVYSQLYSEYVKLHDYFGRGINDVMKVLINISRKARERA